MTKSELIESLSRRQAQLAYKDVELAVKTILEHMANTLSAGERIEIRGFGSFSLHYRPPRVGRNPKSGDPVSLPAKYVPHFKPGKQLRERVDQFRQEQDDARQSESQAS
ncbi:integration host factor subunit beta [Methylohalomonas lacus]|uniref:Integration host factor subunit beta n=1 Tax=Methylohalomonas lacus TaxID=398773 RepID=A0AAE3L0M9_9GAMM|nr:integration host factor subunit beta [Methylohalomonas lacus]MCS3902290.1 integration host factor subunit beta [Methylohalomonas lacus]